MPKLTKRVVDAARCPPDRAKIIVWDGEIPGYGLACYRSGRKSYTMKYSLHGRARWYTLGEHGPLTPDQARKRALRIRGQVADGIDPTEHRRQERESRTTVAELAEAHLETLQVKRPSMQHYRSMLNNHVLPTFGRLRPEAINEDAVRRWHRSLAATPIVANAALTRLSAIMLEAERRGLRAPATNPCRFVKSYPEKSRTRFLSGAELAGVGEALRGLETAGQVSPHAAAAIRLLLFTGCRSGEILNLRWVDVDTEHGIANLPDAKTGARPVYLPAPALQVLDELREIQTPGHPYVVEGQKPGRPMTSVKSAWVKVRKEAGVPDVRIHDLRHTHASWAASGGTPLLVIGKLLGHTQASTTQRYAHLLDSPVREASERVGADIAEALAAEPESEGAAEGDVVH